MIEDAIEYLNVIGELAPSSERPITISRVNELAAERFAHSPRQAERRINRLRAAGLVARERGASGRPAQLWTTREGVRAREAIRTRFER